jgi:hypothetical protein
MKISIPVRIATDTFVKPFFDDGGFLRGPIKGAFALTFTLRKTSKKSFARREKGVPDILATSPH